MATLEATAGIPGPPGRSGPGERWVRSRPSV